MTSSPSSRSVLLRIPNAKASRVSQLGGSTTSETFLALGDLTVYQVQYAGSGSGSASASPSSSKPRSLPPPVPTATRPTVDTAGLGQQQQQQAPPAYYAQSPSTYSPVAGTSRPVPPAPAPLDIPQPSGYGVNSSLSPGGGARSPQRAPSPGSQRTGGGAGLLLAVRTAEFPISTTTTTSFQAPNTYILQNGEGYAVKIELERPRNGSHEILDNLLRKYANLGGTSTGMSRASSASGSETGYSTPEINPQDYRGSLLLIDETTGKVLGPLNQQMNVDESSRITSSEQPGQMSSQDPVVVQFGGTNSVTGEAEVKVSAFDDVTRNYGKSDSKMIGAAEYVSRGILFAAEYGANYTSKAASDYKARTKATDTPLVFSPTTKKSVAVVAKGTEQAAAFTRGAVNFIAGKAEQLGSYAANSGSDGLKKIGIGGGSGASDPNSGWKGTLRAGIVAFSTLAEGVEKGGKHFLETGRQSTNTVVQHRYGDEARDLTDNITSAGSNVVLVYVDARGVMHRALLKRVGKGALSAKMKDGREVVLDDSGMDGQHTRRDEKGNLIVVDEAQDTGYQVNPQGGASYAGVGQATSTALDGQQQQGIHRRPPAPPAPSMRFA